MALSLLCSGFVLEVEAVDAAATVAAYAAKGVPCVTIGSVMASTADARIKISYGDDVVVDEAMVVLRDVWEGTSFEVSQTWPTRGGSLGHASPCLLAPRLGLRGGRSPAHCLCFGAGARGSHLCCQNALALPARLTSQLEKLQTAAECVAQEASGMASRTLPPYTIAAGFVAAEVVPRPLASPVRVATIREEGRYRGRVPPHLPLCCCARARAC